MKSSIQKQQKRLAKRAQAIKDEATAKRRKETLDHRNAGNALLAKFLGMEHFPQDQP